MVPIWQSIVQRASPQEGALAAATHALAWQQAAGTQSASVVQGSVPTTMSGSFWGPSVCGSCWRSCPFVTRSSERCGSGVLDEPHDEVMAKSTEKSPKNNVLWDMCRSVLRVRPTSSIICAPCPISPMTRRSRRLARCLARASLRARHCRHRASRSRSIESPCLLPRRCQIS